MSHNGCRNAQLLGSNPAELADSEHSCMAVPSSKLKSQLEQQVQVRTGRRIRNLSVELEPGCVVLRGQATSYYAKQLAQHGVRDLLPQIRLENAITVMEN